MKQFLHKSLRLLPVPLILIAVNYLTDPAQILTGGAYEQEAATMMLQGHNVLTAANYNVPLLVKDYVQAMPERRDVVVIGSSRTRQLRGDLFAGRAFFNSSVDGATLQDDIANYQLYRNRHFIPSVVVIAADPFIFDENNGRSVRGSPYEQEYYQALASYALAPLPQDDLPPLGILLPAGILEMFSPSYFQASLQALLSGAKFRMPRPLAAESDIDQTYPTVRPDGSWSLSATVRATSPAQVRAYAASYANKKSVSGFGVFSRIEPQSVKVFEAFVRSLRREQVQVILYLGPYHPTAYDVMVRPDKLPLIPTVESYLRAFAAENQLTVVGSYNPAGWAVGTDFYDGIHTTEAGARKTFEHRVSPPAPP